ncbi:aquaporin, partial [bacterium]|nr:aquaporin [bacterium]
MVENFRKYLVEFIGTFFLVFTVASAVLLGGDGVIAPLSIGFVLMIMVYAGGHISGGHYNPAVSLAAALRGALDKKQILPYWISQVLAAIAAVAVILPFAEIPECTGCDFNFCGIILGEFLFTFALCYVVLQVATSKKTEGNSYYGLAIGSTVLVGAFAVGGILTPGAFNPAVAVGLGIMHSACWVTVGVIALTNLAAG